MDRLAVKNDGTPILWGCGHSITEDLLHRQHRGRRKCIQSISQRCCPECEASGFIFMHPADIEGRVRKQADDEAARIAFAALSPEQQANRYRAAIDREIEHARRHGFEDVAERLEDGVSPDRAWLGDSESEEGSRS